MELIPRPRLELAPGAVHIPDWLDLAAQRHLLKACRGWASGMRHTQLPNGGVMSVRTVCLGWHWIPYRYSKTTDDGSPVLPFPDWLANLGADAVAAAHGAANGYRPDTALVNFYDADAKMGLHQDKDERSPDPVVSLSLGDTGVFRFGNTENRGRPWTDVDLRSGDLVVFGGPSRLAYHGVTKIRPGTAAPALGMGGGRLNITLRVSGLDDPSP
ncbi:alpha-ketoglutarate-dependent dioxygenase AlkB [Actinokineospora sp. NBRC 105648]|uniref:alpha-ketoglutarate-dependent dioxygenase AlkB family protein n=1 Tax=Actinokineospora sp. NBRC 105648 TaxID=3032206 RepID=UPI0024A376D5|nr:alpha-ketoglutarate-dependent dioxygenase AlkB [Actinokineospora sp. NBRC 105648]GLZ36547.1 alkylated DNA repair protein [Actinokineospora sp. NBRC 105648]